MPLEQCNPILKENKYLAQNGLMKIFVALSFLFAIPFSSACFSQQSPDTIDIEGKIFERVEVEASYPGGVDAWLQFMMKTANGQVATENGAPIGRYMVIVQFVVATDGKLSDFKPLTRHGYGMEQEVIRVLKQSGGWISAMQNGRPVKAFRKQPVTFQVEQEGVTVTTNTPYTFFSSIENPLSVAVDKIKPADLRLTISQGTIVPKGDGHFAVKVSKPGRVIIRIYNKKDKEVGVVSFEVREK